jgi:hypothetical protein
MRPSDVVRKLRLAAVVLASLGAVLARGDVPTFATALTGANEPAGGSPAGGGVATITLEETGFSWAVWVDGIGVPTSATLRKGPPGVVGPIAVDLGAIRFSSGLAPGFAKVSAPFRDDVLTNPRGYYVEVTTRDFPAGAVRGQLDGGGAAGLSSYTTVLTGANEVPIATTERIAGGANLTLVGGTLRYAVLVNGPLAPTGVVLQRGLAGTTGPVVLELPTSFASGVASGVVAVPPLLADEIRTNPKGFYVNVRSVDFPDGAIRGALAPVDPVTVFVPTVAKADGLNGTRFVTDLRIYNPGHTRATVRLDLFASADEAAGPADTRTVDVDQGAHAIYDDVLGSVFGASGTGALRITSDRYLVVASRVLNDQRPSGHGTTGLPVPALALTDAPRTGALLMLSNASSGDVAKGLGFRTNIGWFNPLGTPVHVTFRARKNDQTVIGSVDLTLAPYARGQLPVFDQISSTPANERAPANFFVTYESDAPLFVYAAVVDNATGDGILLPGTSAR